jgi:transglutaminase superfamily protein
VTEELSFYAAAGPMTTLGGFRQELLAGMPSEPELVARIVQGLVIHDAWAGAYQVTVSRERWADGQIRSAARMLRRVLELDGRALTEARPAASRFVGNCRHFSTLTVALLRYRGVPSRARCGFASYFEPEKWHDHWVVEYWDDGHWVTMDPQIDDLQRKLTGLAADPMALPAGTFLTAGAAWRRCRHGQEDPESFRARGVKGRDPIISNLARDFAALNKVEMLPWDGWGILCSPGASPPEALVDEIAALCISGGFRAIRQRYEADARLKVPVRVHVGVPADAEPDVPELLGGGGRSGLTC